MQIRILDLEKIVLPSLRNKFTLWEAYPMNSNTVTDYENRESLFEDKIR